MAASIHIDGDLRRFYEVPDDSSYTVDGNGYRRYVPNDIPSADKKPVLDVQRDVWSRYVDWFSNNLWSTLAMTRSGGASRGLDELGNEMFATNDYNMQVSAGWKFVPADYPHVLTLVGNYLSDAVDPVFDSDRVISPGVIPYVRMADSLQTYQVSGGEIEAKIDTIISDIDDIEADLTFLKDIEGGKWEIVGDQMLFYKSDNSTLVATFNLTRDADGNPIARDRA